VEIRQGQVFVNGAELAPPLNVAPSWRVAVDGNEDKAPTWNGDSPSFFGPVKLADDTFFVLGDNRDSSLDSRYWGLLEGWRFEGRAVAIYFSYDRGSTRAFPWIREIRGSRIGDRIR